MKVGAILFAFGDSASGRSGAPDSFSAIPGFRVGNVSREKLRAAGVGVERLIMNVSLQTGNKISSDEHENQNEADSYRFLFSFPRKAHARWKP